MEQKIRKKLEITVIRSTKSVTPALENLKILAFKQACISIAAGAVKLSTLSDVYRAPLRCLKFCAAHRQRVGCSVRFPITIFKSGET